MFNTTHTDIKNNRVEIGTPLGQKARVKLYLKNGGTREIGEICKCKSGTYIYSRNVNKDKHWFIKFGGWGLCNALVTALHKDNPKNLVFLQEEVGGHKWISDVDNIVSHSSPYNYKGNSPYEVQSVLAKGFWKIEKRK